MHCLKCWLSRFYSFWRTHLVFDAKCNGMIEERLRICSESSQEQLQPCTIIFNDNNNNLLLIDQIQRNTCHSLSSRGNNWTAVSFLEKKTWLILMASMYLFRYTLKILDAKKAWRTWFRRLNIANDTKRLLNNTQSTSYFMCVKNDSRASFHHCMCCLYWCWKCFACFNVICFVGWCHG